MLSSSSSEDLEDPVCSEHFRKKRFQRSNRHNASRRNQRLQLLQTLNDDPLFYTEMKNHVSDDDCLMNVSIQSYGSNDSIVSMPIDSEPELIMEPYEQTIDFASSSDSQSITTTTSETSPQSPSHTAEILTSWSTTTIHDYTYFRTFDFCQELLRLVRRGNICKTLTEKLLKLIKSGMPVPNQVPSCEQELNMFLNVENLFAKRAVCSQCWHEIFVTDSDCRNCCSIESNSIIQM